MSGLKAGTHLGFNASNAPNRKVRLSRLSFKRFIRLAYSLQTSAIFRTNFCTATSDLVKVLAHFVISEKFDHF